MVRRGFGGTMELHLIIFATFSFRVILVEADDA